MGSMFTSEPNEMKPAPRTEAQGGVGRKESED